MSSIDNRNGATGQFRPRSGGNSRPIAGAGKYEYDPAAASHKDETHKANTSALGQDLVSELYVWGSK
jgi:hypothetical protein